MTITNEFNMYCAKEYADLVKYEKTTDSTGFKVLVNFSIDRCLGAFFFAQQLDNNCYQDLEKSFLKFKQKALDLL